MKLSLKKIVLLALIMGGVKGAYAIPVTVTYTADNVVGVYGLCDAPSCDTGTIWANGPNASNWTQSDSLVQDLAAGTYSIAFFLGNQGNASNRNPAGFLGEISSGTQGVVTSASWEVTTCQALGAQCDYNGWTSATEYGANGTAIWGSVLGGPVAGISSNAQWIWSANNFANGDQYVAVKTQFTVAEVPEPAPVALLGLGLALFGVARKRR